jgi:hypothetical protein
MSCSQGSRWRDRLDELAAGELSPRQAAEMRAHVDGCESCANAYRETQTMLSLLHRIGDEPVPDDFSRSLHRKLVTEPAPVRPGALQRLRDAVTEWLSARPMRGAFVGAAIAAAAIGTPLVLRHRVSHAPVLAGEVPPIFMVPREKVAVVRIDFHAEVAIEDVEFAIKLPEGLHFVSEGRELPDREFRWRGRLEAGSNPIPVAVRGRRPGRYTLAAHAVGPDVATQHNVVLEVTS